MGKFIGRLDLEELLYFSAGLTEDEVSSKLNEEADPYLFCFENFGCELEAFEQIANKLIKLTLPIQTAITKDKIHAFAVKDGKFHRIVARVEVNKKEVTK